MSNSKPKYYLTTPIYYANSRPHVGSAYTTIVCDVIARYKRMCGYDVAYLTGTDEHGVNIERAAEKLGISPQHLVDRNQQIFRDLWKLLGISYTDFIRTTSPSTRAPCRIWSGAPSATKSAAERRFSKRKYEGRYCIYDNLYVSDTPEPADCQICGRPAELISEENYFFRLSAYQEKLLELYERPARFRATRFPPQRSKKLRRKRTERSFHQPQDHQVGHSLAGRSRACLLCLVRRAYQLHERHRLRGRRPNSKKDSEASSDSGPPTST